MIVLTNVKKFKVQTKRQKVKTVFGLIFSILIPIMFANLPTMMIIQDNINNNCYEVS